ncbi:MAG: hypothetical protein GY940_42395, partial [bacterium]|nr:hypothetical protein [bacterium]
FVEIVYSYSAQHNTDVASVELQAHYLPFSSIACDERKGVTFGREKLQLPHHSIKGPFPLTFFGHFYPVVIDPCKWSPRDMHWFTVFNTSRLIVPRDFYLKMPELKWFRLWGYPFVDNPESPTVHIRHEDSPQAREAALNLAFFLGQKGSLAPVRFHASVTGKHPLPDNANVIRIFTRFPDPSADPIPESIFKQVEFHKILREETGYHEVRTRRVVGGYEELLLSADERVLLNIHTPDRHALKYLIKSLSRVETVDDFSGNAVSVDSLGNRILVKSLSQPKQEQWGKLSSGRKAKRFFLDNLGTILIAAPLFILLIFIIIKLIKFIVKRRKKSSGDTESEEKNE